MLREKKNEFSMKSIDKLLRDHKPKKNEKMRLQRKLQNCRIAELQNRRTAELNLRHITASSGSCSEHSSLRDCEDAPRDYCTGDTSRKGRAVRTGYPLAQPAPAATPKPRARRQRNGCGRGCRCVNRFSVSVTIANLCISTHSTTSEKTLSI